MLFRSGSKVSKKQALELKKKFSYLGTELGLIMKVILTDGSQPIGNGIGPALEMTDVLHVLQRQDSPKDLENKSLKLAAAILEMSGKSKKGHGLKKAKDVLNSGKAYEKFKQIIEAQKGHVVPLKTAKFTHTILAKKLGKINLIDNRKINHLGRLGGCPIDKGAGLYLHKHVNDKVKKGDSLVTFYSESEIKLSEMISYYSASDPIVIK